MALTFSVVTPSYNQGEFIERTILSVLNQTVPAMEYLVFDGGSKDQTIDILKKYEKKLTWVSEKDGGQTNAVNKGLKLAKGDIIAWLNSDDIYYPDTFKIVQKFFVENPAIDIVYGKANNIDKANQIIEEYLVEPWDFDRLKSHCFLSQPAVFFRRKIVEQYGLLDESLNFCMDYEYWLRLGKAGVTFGYLPVVLAGSRLYQETKTMDQRIPVHIEIIKMLRSKFGKIPDRWFSNYAHAIAESRNIDKKNRQAFLPVMIITTILTSLRWNKGISKTLRKSINKWIGEYIDVKFKKKETTIEMLDCTLIDLFPVETQKKRIVVDLTRLQAGGENGGAKLMTVELIAHMSSMSPEYQFFLITPSRCHDELFYLDAPNVQRICIVDNKRDSFLVNTQLNKGKNVQVKTSRQLLSELKADLLFNPLTEPLFFEPSIPSVSVIYDLQYAYYPEFFSKEQYEHRDRHVKDACRLSNYVVCISDYVRETVLEKVKVKTEKVSSIPIRLSERLDHVSDREVKKIKERFSLKNTDYILYPANFWLHKNHVTLFKALALYRSENPHSSLKLVCTGTPNDYLPELQKMVTEMNLDDWVIFPGYVTVKEFSALLKACKAVIFPSLYEGFGMPILEAMAFGKPVFCSQVTSLPEVGGKAAFFFDPENPKDIAQAIKIIETKPELLQDLVSRGHEHMKTISGPKNMAFQYKQIFEQALNSFNHCSNAVYGLYPDNWTNDRVIITHDSIPINSKKRVLEMEWFVPGFVPNEKIHIEMHDRKAGFMKKEVVSVGGNLKMSHELPVEASYIEFKLSPVFQPKAHNFNEDMRMLACVCKGCCIVSEDGHRLNLLEKES